MRETSKNYERIAKIYDSLTKIISFGGNKRTQNIFLSEVEPCNAILVVGCGSVDFSIEVAKKGAKVTCLDISQTMLDILREKAKKANIENSVEFICCNVMNFEKFGLYDCVAVNYFLNVFDFETMEEVFSHVTKFLKPGGKLFLADEVKAENKSMIVIQKMLRPIVYRAHNLLVNNAIHEIYDYMGLLKRHHFDIVKRVIDKSQCMQSIVAIKIIEKGEMTS